MTQTWIFFSAIVLPACSQLYSAVVPTIQHDLGEGSCSQLLISEELVGRYEKRWDLSSLFCIAAPLLLLSLMWYF